MLIMARDRDYSDLLETVRGKTVSIWTCNTCARLCYGLGGKDSAENLAKKLKEDGMDVKDIGSTSAGCMEPKLMSNASFGKGSDVIISLTCGIGARCAKEVFGTDVINPVVTFGAGFLDAEGEPVLYTIGDDGTPSERKLSDVLEKMKPETAPYV